MSLYSPEMLTPLSSFWVSMNSTLLSLNDVVQILKQGETSQFAIISDPSDTLEISLDSCLQYFRVFGSIDGGLSLMIVLSCELSADMQITLLEGRPSFKVVDGNGPDSRGHPIRRWFFYQRTISLNALLLNCIRRQKLYVFCTF